MNKLKLSFLAASLCLAQSFSQLALAHPGHTHDKSVKSANGKKMQAPAEVKKGAVGMYNGPAEAKGVSVQNLASIPLGFEIAGMDKRLMRARIFTIAAGGAVPPHPHNDRPGHAYIISGEITEFRNDEDAPKIRKEGDIAVEKKGVDHAWINHTTQPVKVLVVDVFNP
jgi:quercetin dioxygenase-like cupin family protein